jgi:hypothetical protein
LSSSDCHRVSTFQVEQIKRKAILVNRELSLATQSLARSAILNHRSQRLDRFLFCIRESSVRFIVCFRDSDGQCPFLICDHCARFPFLIRDFDAQPLFPICDSYAQFSFSIRDSSAQLPFLIRDLYAQFSFSIHHSYAQFGFLIRHSVRSIYVLDLRFLRSMSAPYS